MRKSILALTVLAAAAGGGSVARAQGDAPYYKLNYARFDTTYESVDAQARHYVAFTWDGKSYCRYRAGWNGPGVYAAGMATRRGYGWEGGYPWQGPGTPADHDDDEDFAASQAEYAADFRSAGACGPRLRRHRHHRVVLHRKD